MIIRVASFISQYPRNDGYFIPFVSFASFADLESSSLPVALWAELVEHATLGAAISGHLRHAP